MIKIRNFTADDMDALRRMYPNKTDKDIDSLLAEWDAHKFNGKYVEAFAVCADGEIAGSIFLYQHNDYIVSAGPEILPEYRRRGYAYEAMTLAYEYAKKQGYKIATAQIRKDNLASIRLHEKLGFILDCEMINKRGHEVFIYLKAL